MADEIRLWRIGEQEALCEINRRALDLEARLQEWLARDISILDSNLLVIGREVETDFGGFIDLLCLDNSGDIVVVELKRDKTPREIVAQVLDYASWVVDLSNERISTLAEAYLGPGRFEESFKQRFDGQDVPETLNASHRMLIVGSRIDASSERIIKYLSGTHGVNINAATFQYFREQNGAELLARVFLIDPAQVDRDSTAKGTAKRRPRLTYDELVELAEQAGVGDLYQHAVASFEPHMQKYTTATSLGFASLLDGSRKSVLSLLPRQSSAEQGLGFQVYFHRLCSLLAASEDVCRDVLPDNRRPWSYNTTGGPEFEGFEGHITSSSEIDRLHTALASAEKNTAAPLSPESHPG